MCRSAVPLTLLLVSIAPAAHAQEHYTLGPVQRIILLDIKPGEGISIRHYGSYGKRSEVGVRRSESGTVVSSFLVRTVSLKELPR